MPLSARGAAKAAPVRSGHADGSFRCRNDKRKNVPAVRCADTAAERTVGVPIAVSRNSRRVIAAHMRRDSHAGTNRPAAGLIASPAAAARAAYTRLRRS